MNVEDVLRQVGAARMALVHLSGWPGVDPEPVSESIEIVITYTTTGIMIGMGEEGALSHI